MTQGTIVIANGAGAAVRAAINTSNEATVTKQSGASAPSPTYPFMDWADTANDLLKQRNAANSAWIIKGTLSAAYGGIPASGVLYSAGSPTLIDASNVQDALDFLAESQVQGITLMGAMVAASGTAVGFTGIPSVVKRITFQFSDLSLSGTAGMLVQIGTSSGYETTGYKSGGSRVVGAAIASTTSTSGLLINSDTSSYNVSGSITLTLMNAATNLWVASGVMSGDSTVFVWMTAGYKALAGTLDRIRVVSSNGTDTFDAGNVNVLYE